jgi:hypothetical protein
MIVLSHRDPWQLVTQYTPLLLARVRPAGAPTPVPALAETGLPGDSPTVPEGEIIHKDRHQFGDGQPLPRAVKMAPAAQR